MGEDIRELMFGLDLQGHTSTQPGKVDFQQGHRAQEPRCLRNDEGPIVASKSRNGNRLQEEGVEDCNQV